MRIILYDHQIVIHDFMVQPAVICVILLNIVYYLPACWIQKTKNMPSLKFNLTRIVIL